MFTAAVGCHRWAKTGSFPVQKSITRGGFKFLLPKGDWVTFRANRTEPVFRSTIEARSQANDRKLRKACEQLLTA